MPRPAHDLLDRSPLLGKAENGRVVFLAAQISLVLDPLGSREQARIDRGRADRGTYLAHGFTHRIEKGAARILH